MLKNLAAYTRGGLPDLDEGAVAKVTFDEEYHFVISHENIAAADIVEPSLHPCLYAVFVLIGTGSSRCDSRRHGGNESLGVGGDEMIRQLDKFGVQSSHITVLRRAESRKVSVDIESEERVFLSSALKARDLGLQLILWLRWPLSLGLLNLLGVGGGRALRRRRLEGLLLRHGLRGLLMHLRRWLRLEGAGAS